MEYLKKAGLESNATDTDTTATVRRLLASIDAGGEAEVRRLNAQFDDWHGEVIVPPGQFARAAQRLPGSVKDDLAFAHQRVTDFARRQLESMHEFEVELSPGLTAGQRLVPVTTAGCYVPGGRYAHAASAIMSVATARVAGVDTLVVATPANGKNGIHPAILYALELSGATLTLAAGGVQGVAALARGLFSGHPADVIVGPGNRYVAAAKRILFGQVGIDVVAGPTESLVIADDTADPAVVAADLAGQAEHGADSPVWLVTTSRRVGEAVLARMPAVIAALPEPARTAAAAAWRDYGEIVLATDRDDACRISDGYAPEHLHVQAADPGWWLQALRNYGSLFLGEETTVAFGDKCSGPNHILPTRGGARYTGGLSVARFVKVLTYQRMTRAATRDVAPVAARISRLEGMEGHARTGDIRLKKYFPGESFRLEAESVARDA